MRRVMWILVLIALTAALAIFVFGFLATFEPPGWPVLRAVYACAGLATMLAAVWILHRRLTR